jgi:hypothetical protein
MEHDWCYTKNVPSLIDSQKPNIPLSGRMQCYRFDFSDNLTFAGMENAL